MKTAKFIQFALLLRYRTSAEALVLFGLLNGQNISLG